MRQIPDDAARELGQMFHRACREMGLTDEQVAERATTMLAPEAPASLVIVAPYVTALRGTPRRPLSRPDSRHKLRAVVDALGLDRAEINRLAGGL